MRANRCGSTAARDASPQIPHMPLYSKAVPIYWKPKYATRSQRHRAWARADARREAALRRDRGPGVWARLRAWLAR
jgi:hypothetical protein